MKNSSIKNSLPVYLVCGPLSKKEFKRSPKKIENCGGYLVLSLLVKKLNSFGYRTEYIGTNDIQLKKLYQEGIEKGEIIVIYPEAIIENPLNAKKVIRWVLYHVSQKILDKWQSDGNLVFFYWDQFHPQKIPKFILNTMDIRFDLFKDLKKERSGICYRIAKGSDYHSDFIYHHKKNVKKYINSIFNYNQNTMINIGKGRVTKLSDNLTLDQMAKIFNEYQLFISYDCETAVSVIAALCGCISVIVPKKGMNKEDLLPPLKYGIAYGLNDIHNSLATVHLLKNHLRHLIQWGDKTVHDFVNITLCEKYW